MFALSQECHWAADLILEQIGPAFGQCLVTSGLFGSTWRSACDIDERDGQVVLAKRTDEGAGPGDHIRNGVDEWKIDDALLKVGDDQSGFGVERRKGHF
jgi:hypothetical protein